MSQTFLEESHFTPKEELYEHAALSVLRSSFIALPGTSEWIAASIMKKPVEICDLNGKLLFLDFCVRKGTQTLGYVRTCASGILGSPVLAHELGERHWDFDLAVKKLSPQIRKENPSSKILDTKLVCYSYPKLGVMFEMADSQGRKTRRIFDVAALSPIIEGPIKSGMEGPYSWSFYDAIPEEARSVRLEQFALYNKLRSQIPLKTRELLRTSSSLLRLKDAIKWQINRAITKQLQFCDHYGYDEARSHHCFVLHGQQTDDYCAVATAQMILCYYRYYYSQDDIAPALGYSAGSGCPSDQSSGYEKLSCSHIDATYDSSPTWEKARDEINALHPFKSGISGHARACAGHSSVLWLIPILRPLLKITDRKLFIYDPWPWNSDYKLGGSVYWEDWDSVTHTNFVLTRILCSQD